jgi:pimeloyl-ACP methyl ester carboxylesterase
VNETSGHFDTGDVDLSYLEWPGDSPPVLLLHGVGGGASVWRGWLAARGEHHAYAFDARGHGDSGRATSYRFVDYGGDAVRFLEGVVREPAILIGHSLGGMMAVYAAANCPELVRAAVLIDPPLYAPMTGMAKRDERPMFERARDMAGKPIDELLAAGLPERMTRSLSKVDGRTFAQLIDNSAAEGWDTDALLRLIDCPVLLQHGERSHPGMGSALYAGEVERAAACLRNGTIFEIKGSGHVPMIEQPEAFYAAVARFIERVSSS